MVTLTKEITSLCRRILTIIRESDLNVIKRRILEYLLKKPAPERIPRSSPHADNVDCNVVYFRSQKNNWTLLLEKVSPRGITGKFWSDGDELGKVSIPFNLIGDFELDIIHFYGPNDFRYDSLSKYFWKGFIPIDKTKLLLHKGQQFLFNKKELVRSERIEVLKLILEKELDDGGYETSPVCLSTLLHTEKWVFHPDKSRQLRYNNLLLNSLYESGDLEKTQHGFRLSPKALVTLSQFQADQNKQKQSDQQASSMKWLTFALVAVGIAQVFVTFL